MIKITAKSRFLISSKASSPDGGNSTNHSNETKIKPKHQRITDIGMYLFREKIKGIEATAKPKIQNKGG
ncbi:MAG: hypothetical protein RM338_31360 [Nostoc sp. DedQUE12a]|nr:hypothetical protein [Nostoc sp. DedQUE12a]